MSMATSRSGMSHQLSTGTKNVSVTVKQQQPPKRKHQPNVSSPETVATTTATTLTNDTTPVMSNRGSGLWSNHHLGPKFNVSETRVSSLPPPPLELPRPIITSNQAIVSNKTDMAVQMRYSNSEKKDALDSSVANQGETEEEEEEEKSDEESNSESSPRIGPRFSSSIDPPIVVQQWPSNRYHQDHVPVPRTISVNTNICGIPNYGQTCFLNSVVQSLASLTAFDVYLKTHLRASRQLRLSWRLHGMDDHDDDDSPLYLTRLLWRAIEYVNGRAETTPQQSKWDPRQLLDTVAQSHKQFQSLHQQQDAQELLTALLDVLVQEQESRRSVKPLPATPEQEELVFSSYTPPATLWALSPSFIRLQLAAFPIIDKNKNGDNDDDEEEEDQAAWKSYDVDDDMVSVASSARERAFQRRKEQNVTASYAAAPGKHGDAVTIIKRPEEKSSCQDEHNNGTATTISLSGTAHTNPPLEKKHENFEVHVPTNDSEEEELTTMTPSVTAKRLHLHEDKKMAAETEEDAETMSDLSASVMPPQPSSMSQASLTSQKSSCYYSSAWRHLQPRPAERLAMPLGGWMGSTLQCRACHYVRPIQNTPFVDLSVVPTGISNPFHMSKSSHDVAPCTIEECLSEFTRVERVEQVDCPSCTKLFHLKQIKEEVEFWEFTLEGAAAIHQKRQQQQRGLPGTDGKLESIQEELERHRETLRQWERINCDDDDCAEQMGELLGLLEGEKLTLVRRDANKCLFLTRLPPVFCLHVQRRYYDAHTSRLSKTMQPVIFDEFLNVAPYCAYTTSRGTYRGQAAPSWVAGKSSSREGVGTRSSSCSTQQPRQIFYRLTSVLEHRGDANCGHYVCYRRSPSGEWWFVSDHVVRRVSLQTVRQCQAYMLFYENSNISEVQ